MNKQWGDQDCGFDSKQKQIVQSVAISQMWSDFCTTTDHRGGAAHTVPDEERSVSFAKILKQGHETAVSNNFA